VRESTHSDMPGRVFWPATTRTGAPRRRTPAKLLDLRKEWIRKESMEGMLVNRARGIGSPAEGRRQQTASPGIARRSDPARIRTGRRQRQPVDVGEHGRVTSGSRHGASDRECTRSAGSRWTQATRDPLRFRWRRPRARGRWRLSPQRAAARPAIPSSWDESRSATHRLRRCAIRMCDLHTDPATPLHEVPLQASGVGDLRLI
jgi:hypothetical protein